LCSIVIFIHRPYTIGNFQDTGTDGEYTFDVTNNTEESIALTITVVGVDLDDNPGITFE